MDIEHWNSKNLPIPSEITRLYEREILELVINEANKMAISLSNENFSSFAPLNPENFLQNLKAILQKMHQNIKTGLKYLKLENTALFAYLYQNGRHRGEKFMQVLKKKWKRISKGFKSLIKQPEELVVQKCVIHRACISRSSLSYASSRMDLQIDGFQPPTKGTVEVEETTLDRKCRVSGQIKKLVKCMKNWEEINLYLLITNHLQMFPSDFINIKCVRLPTTNSMQFLLSRLLGSYHLLMKTSSYCLQAAYYLRSKLLTGHFFANATVAFAFVARIRALSLDMAFTIAESYDEVHPILSCIFKVCTNEEYPAFPCNLKDEFQKELKNRSTVQENPDESDCDVDCKNMLYLNPKVEKDDNSDSASTNITNIKKSNLDSSVSPSNSSKTLAFNTNKRLEHDCLFSSSAMFNENEDLGTYIDEKNFALIKKVMSKNINNANKRMQNLCKEGKINKKVQKKKKKKIEKLIK